MPFGKEKQTNKETLINAIWDEEEEGKKEEKQDREIKEEEEG